MISILELKSNPAWCLRQQPSTASRLTCTCHDGPPRTFHPLAMPKDGMPITFEMQLFGPFDHPFTSLLIHVPRTIQNFTICFPQSVLAIVYGDPCPLVPCEEPVQFESQSQSTRKSPKLRQRRLHHGQCAQARPRPNPRHMIDWEGQHRWQSLRGDQVQAFGIQKTMLPSIPHPLYLP